MQRTDSSAQEAGRPDGTGSIGDGSGLGFSGATPPPAGTAAKGARAAAERGATMRLQSLSLGIAALGGAWQAAAADVAVWMIRVSDGLFVASGLIWIVLIVRYLLHGGNRWQHLRDDLRHPSQGFTMAYVPIVGMLGAGHFSRFGIDGARWVYAVFLVMTALVAARLMAHWASGGVTTAELHPGFLLPVVSAPFIASAMADALRLPMLGYACFAVGVFSWLSVGTVVLGRLMTGGALHTQARPALTVLVIPPATGGIAWLVAHGGRIDVIGYGIAGIFVFTVLVVLFLLPEVRQSPFHVGFWVFGFPVAASAHFIVRWMDAVRVPDWWIIAWVALSAASVFFAVLIFQTLVHARPGGTPSATASKGAAT